MGEKVMPEYSQGICGDGAAILKDGVMLTIDEIVSELNAAAQHERIVAGLEVDAKRYRAIRNSYIPDVRQLIERSLYKGTRELDAAIDAFLA